MKVIRNIPNFIKVFRSIRIFDFYAKDITAARNEGDPVKEREAIAYSTHIWASKVAEMFDMKIEVEGRENIPEKDGCVFISNHQGYGDIIALFLALEGRQIGFIAKDSLESMPYFGKWIKNIRGIYIKRGNAKEALQSIQNGAKTVKNGFNLVIFPEGTRSRGPVMGEFKGGSFKLATKAKAPIVPITINGTYKMYEETGLIKPCNVKVVIHPAVDTSALDRKQLGEMEHQVEATIRTTLEELVKEEKQ
jgi:1-acyl-sn-glycerol-3-phosphate acyltransferase